MSRVQPEDEFNTRQLILGPKAVKNNRTWLRHKADGESGLIDLMILDGNYSIDEMAEELSRNTSLTPKDIGKWKKRIENHILHLSTLEGDSGNRASGQKGHNLKLKKTSSGKIRFDV